MLAALLALLAKLFGMFLNKTPPIVPVAKEAGAAEADLATERQANADVLQAVEAARDVAAHDAAHPDSLRDGSDPDCRDCTAS